MSGTALLIMCAVIVVVLAAWLVSVIFADRFPYFRHARIEPRRGRVQGGTHVGGGRSVAPRRDGEVSPADSPDQPTVPGRDRRGTSPLDL